MKYRRWAAWPLLTAIAVLVSTMVATTPAQAATPALKLFTPATSLTATVTGAGTSSATTSFTPALYLAASPTAAFEVDVFRTSYASPISAVASIGGAHHTVPASLLNGWHGFSQALTYTWRNSSGAVVKRAVQDWCPNNTVAGRSSTAGAYTNRYDTFCVAHPFALNDRWGIERGWASQILGTTVPMPALSVGAHYTMQVKLRDGLGSFLGIPASARTVTYHVAVAAGTAPASATGPVSGSGSSAAAASPDSASSRSRVAAPKVSLANDREAPKDTLPDLVALPALGIEMHREGGRDELDFSATVYNAGQAPLVVDGFRRGSSTTMDAYQSFYRGSQVVANANVGTMVYDPRPTHMHWHFSDFAVYDMVNSSGKVVATSGKEAFCLAPTDPIAMLQAGAIQDPGDSDLATACGNVSSIWVREVLAAGWGDTYAQFRAGQSLDVTNLANGTYRIRITANPAGHLHEVTRSNDTALRTVVLGGTPGHRTARVAPYQSIDTEAFDHDVASEG